MSFEVVTENALLNVLREEMQMNCSVNFRLASLYMNMAMKFAPQNGNRVQKH